MKLIKNLFLLQDVYFCKINIVIILWSYISAVFPPKNGKKDFNLGKNDFFYISSENIFLKLLAQQNKDILIMNVYTKPGKKI